MNDPIILAFDTSAAHCAAALLQGDRLLATRLEAMSKGQVERLIPLVQEVLDEAAIILPEVSAIGVGIGPGNFTGIRISVSAARGLALALKIPAIGVSSLEALAFGQPQPVLACIDARREHLYLQRFGADVARGPELVGVGDLAQWACPDLHMIGGPSVELADRIGAQSIETPLSPAPAIARIAATRMGQSDLPRPAPLYLRAADAAPSRDAPVVILP